MILKIGIEVSMEIITEHAIGNMHRNYFLFIIRMSIYSTASKVIDTKEKKEYDRETGVKRLRFYVYTIQNVLSL